MLVVELEGSDWSFVVRLLTSFFGLFFLFVRRGDYRFVLGGYGGSFLTCLEYYINLVMVSYYL